MSYFNKDKVFENLPDFERLTDTALQYYLGNTEVKAFKDEGVPSYSDYTYFRTFDQNGNIRRYDPEIEDNLWTGVVTEQLQDIENWRDLNSARLTPKFYYTPRSIEEDTPPQEAN